MQDWINQLIELAVGPVRQLAQDVRDRFLAFWALVTRFFTASAEQWHRIAVGAGLVWLHGLAWQNEAYTTLRWLIQIRGPAWLASTLRSATRYADAAVMAVRRLAQRLVDDAVSWADRKISEVIHAASQFKAWVTDRLASAEHTLALVARRVADLLTSPERLAVWLAGAMWSALWRYAMDNAGRYGQALWRRRRSVEGHVLGWILDMIARII